MAKTATKPANPPAPAPITEAQFNDAQAAYVRAAKRHAALATKMEEAMTKIKSKYADELTKLEEETETALTTCKTYCEENKKALFDDKKRSIDTRWGRLGFKTSPPALTLCEGISWEEVVKALKKSRLKAYVRTKEEADKKALLADRDKPAIVNFCKRTGVKAEQGENFYFTPTKLS